MKYFWWWSSAGHHGPAATICVTTGRLSLPEASSRRTASRAARSCSGEWQKIAIARAYTSFHGAPSGGGVAAALRAGGAITHGTHAMK